MARKRTKLTVSAAQAAQLKQQIRAATDSRDKERLQVALWATGGRHSLAQLAQLAGRARSTIQIEEPNFFRVVRAFRGCNSRLEKSPKPSRFQPFHEPLDRRTFGFRFQLFVSRDKVAPLNYETA
jgi:hypothetical protein